MAIVNMQTLVYGLLELGSLSYQEALWIKSDLADISSFEEAICTVFDDAGVTRSIDSGKFVEQFSVSARRAALSLDGAIRRVDLDAEPERLIASEAMEKVRTLANEFLETIGASAAKRIQSFRETNPDDFSKLEKLEVRPWFGAASSAGCQVVLTLGSVSAIKGRLIIRFTGVESFGYNNVSARSKWKIGVIEERVKGRPYSRFSASNEGEADLHLACCDFDVSIEGG